MLHALTPNIPNSESPGLGRQNRETLEKHRKSLELSPVCEEAWRRGFVVVTPRGALRVYGANLRSGGFINVKPR